MPDCIRYLPLSEGYKDSMQSGLRHYGISEVEQPLTAPRRYHLSHVTFIISWIKQNPVVIKTMTFQIGARANSMVIQVSRDFW